MTRLAADVHAIHGRYQVVIAVVTEQDGPRVTVQAWIVPEPGRGPADTAQERFRSPRRPDHRGRRPDHRVRELSMSNPNLACNRQGQVPD